MDNGTRFIGLCVIDPDVALESARAAGMKAVWLPKEWHRQAYDCIVEMSAGGKPIDASFVADYAKRTGRDVSEEALEMAVASAPAKRRGADGLVVGLRADYVQAETEAIGERLWSASREDPIVAAADAANALMGLLEHKWDVSTESLKDEIRLQWRESLAGNLPGLPMPWSRFMHQVGGPRKKMVTTLVGHGGSGKSSAFLQWAHYLGSRGIPCAVFPFEDGMQMAYERLAGMDADVSVFGIHIGHGTQDHVDRLERGLDRVMTMPIHVCDRRGTISDIAMEAQRLKARNGIQAVFLDSFKDISRGAEGVEGDNEVMSGIVALAHRLNIPVIVGHHVRKAPSALKANTWESWHIGKDDLRGSGRLWDDSRSVIALQMYPDKVGGWEYYFHQMKSNHGIANCRQRIERTGSLLWKEIGAENLVKTS